MGTYIGETSVHAPAVVFDEVLTPAIICFFSLMTEVIGLFMLLPRMAKIGQIKAG
jgi:hypothetical protein